MALQHAAGSSVVRDRVVTSTRPRWCPAMTTPCPRLGRRDAKLYSLPAPALGVTAALTAAAGMAW